MWRWPGSHFLQALSRMDPLPQLPALRTGEGGSGQQWAQPLLEGPTTAANTGGGLLAPAGASSARSLGPRVPCSESDPCHLLAHQPASETCKLPQPLPGPLPPVAHHRIGNLGVEMPKCKQPVWDSGEALWRAVGECSLGSAQRLTQRVENCSPQLFNSLL